MEIVGAEGQAAKLFQQGNYEAAAVLYCNCLEQLVSPNDKNNIYNEKRIQILLNRSMCYLKLKKFQPAIEDCDMILDNNHINVKAYTRKIKALTAIGQFCDAFETAKKWSSEDPLNLIAKKEVKRLDIVVTALQCQDLDDDEDDDDVITIENSDTETRIPPEGREDEMQTSPNITPTTAVSSTSQLASSPSSSLTNLNSLSTFSSKLSAVSKIMPDKSNLSPSPMQNLTLDMDIVCSSSKSDIDSALPIPIPEGSALSDSESASSNIDARDLLSRSLDSGSSSSDKIENVDGENHNHTADNIRHICNKIFIDSEGLTLHLADNTEHGCCSSNKEDEKTWVYRDPPRGLTADEYTKCPRFTDTGTCRYGIKCTEAHSENELTEWKERFEYHRLKLQKAKEEAQEGNSYAEQLLEKWMNADYPEAVMTAALGGIKVYCNSDLSVLLTTKRCTHAWLFTLTSKFYLSKVVLLDDSRRHFNITTVTIGPKKNQKSQKLDDSCQDWLNPLDQSNVSNNETVYRVKVLFRTDIFGTFRQTVVFDFGMEPVLCQQLCVDSSPVMDIEKLQSELTLSEHGRWDTSVISVVPFSPAPFKCLDSDELLSRYTLPSVATIASSQCSESVLNTKDNYQEKMHNLLHIEEMAQYSNIAKYNVKTCLDLTKRFMLCPSTCSTAKYAQNGELFGFMKLATDISEDTAHGRLILQNVNQVYIAPANKYTANNSDPDKVYEALLEEKGKDFIYIKLSSQTVSDLKLEVDRRFYAEVQFQLNRLPLCEMHLAVDKLPDTSLIYPDLSVNIKIPCDPQRYLKENFDSKLNAKQREAVIALTTPLSCRLPPILLIGPYGTGKTFTLAQAAIQLVKQPDTRLLICTHSNSAADLYIKDYLHAEVESGNEDARPLRIMFQGRWIQTVNTTVLKYCLLDPQTYNSQFRAPTKEDIRKHRIVVTTLSSTRTLYDLGLEKGYFTHFLLDEAAQAMELQTIMPLALADGDSRIVLAGDHMQMSPEVHSDFAQQHGLHISLLERLYDMFPKTNICKILLCENYRSHKAIIEFTSELFYDNNLITSGSQPRHEVFFPLTFFTARGEDIQHQNSTGFYNNAEVYEIAERVAYIQKMWPKTWGDFDDGSIGVVSPYADQVVRIRAELRKRKLGSVNVERVFNVQGKQFRVIFISTVRTRHTCSMDNKVDGEIDYGFLSSVKLLNTAITRAQSLVAVVGDPVSLCTIGKCRKVWESFIDVCQNNNSLYGITWNQLRNQIDGIELKKTYVLNPLAPEFIPNRLRHASAIQQMPLTPNRVFPQPPSTHSHIMFNKAAPISMQPLLQPILPQLPMYHQPMGFGYYGMTPWFPRIPSFAPPHPATSHNIRSGLNLHVDPIRMPPLVVPTHNFVPPPIPAPTTSDHYTVVSVSRPNSSESCSESNQGNRLLSAGQENFYKGKSITANTNNVAPSHLLQFPSLHFKHQFVKPSMKVASNGDGIKIEKSSFNSTSRKDRNHDAPSKLTSPFLHNEVYSYIYQKDGQEEADRFMQKLCLTSFEGQPLIQNDKKSVKSSRESLSSPDMRKEGVKVSVGHIRHRTISQSSGDSDNGLIPGWQNYLPQNQSSRHNRSEFLNNFSFVGKRNVTKSEILNKNATVRVSAVLESENHSQKKSDLISDFLKEDPDAPIAVDQVVRFLEDSIDSNDSDSSDEVNGNRQGYNTPTYAGILRGDRKCLSSPSQQSGMFNFTEHGAIPLTSKNTESNVTPVSQNNSMLQCEISDTSAIWNGTNMPVAPLMSFAGSKTHVNRHYNPLSGSPNRLQNKLVSMPVTSRVVHTRTTDILPYMHHSPDQHHDIFGLFQHRVVPPANQEEEVSDPLELLRNLNIKESPGTQAFYKYFS